tara:strand:- start:3628 stop:4041 length:414 start_codon:yes stop_codon:yes gene_type:complete
MLPQPARGLVPDEVTDSQLAFWWAAFELGRSSAAAALDPAAGFATAAAVDGVPGLQTVDQDGDQGEPDWVEHVIAYAVDRVPGANQDALGQLLRTDDQVSAWIERDELPSERVWTMVVDGVLERARLVKDPMAGMGD